MTEDDTFNALSQPPTEDEIYFGRRSWVYCNQHVRPHVTGWCSVSNKNKFKLDAKTGPEALQECRDKGYRLF